MPFLRELRNKEKALLGLVGVAVQKKQLCGICGQCPGCFSKDTKFVMRAIGFVQEVLGSTSGCQNPAPHSSGVNSQISRLAISVPRRDAFRNQKGDGSGARDSRLWNSANAAGQVVLRKYPRVFRDKTGARAQQEKAATRRGCHFWRPRRYGGRTYIRITKEITVVGLGRRRRSHRHHYRRRAPGEEAEEAAAQGPL